MSKGNVMDFVVKGSDGSIDREKTLDTFEASLDAHIELLARDQTVLAEAIETIWSEMPTATIQTPALVTLALSRTGFTPANYQALRERAEDVIRSNPRYYVVKGANGGVRRQSDAEMDLFAKDGLNPNERQLAAKKAAKASK